MSSERSAAQHEAGQRGYGGRASGGGKGISRKLDDHPLIFGDWTRLVRDGVDLLRLAFLVGAVVAAFLGVWSTAATLGFGFLVSLLGRLAQLPRPFDLAFVLAIGMDIWANVAQLYKIAPWYDYIVHFFLPMAFAAGVYLLFAQLDVVPDVAGRTTTRQRVGIVVITWTLGLSLGTIYEMYEFGAVRLLGSGLHIGYADTIEDLADNMVGALAGGLLLLLWTVRGWGTRRRMRGRPLEPHWRRGLVESDER